MMATHEVGDGLIRFGVDEARVPLTWRYHVRTSGMKVKVARHLERIARELGADPSPWRVVYEPMPIVECVFEVWEPDSGWHVPA